MLGPLLPPVRLLAGDLRRVQQGVLLGALLVRRARVRARDGCQGSPRRRLPGVRPVSAARRQRGGERGVTTPCRQWKLPPNESGTETALPGAGLQREADRTQFIYMPEVQRKGVHEAPLRGGARLQLPAARQDSGRKAELAESGCKAEQRRAVVQRGGAERQAEEPSKCH